MQRIVPMPGGVNSYLDDPNQAAKGQALQCCLCTEHHNLCLHAWYKRWAIFADGRKPVQVSILRLLCKATGRTVSLLPDFCIPRRQNGPAVLAVFVFALVFEKATLCAALLKARGDLSPGAVHHSQAQSLRDGFVKRLPDLRAYLAGFKTRCEPAPSEVGSGHRDLAVVLQMMRQGWVCIQEAFVFHGRSLHARCGTALL